MDPSPTLEITTAIKQLPGRKVPGVDHLWNEMLKPLVPMRAPLLLSLYKLCWTWAYIPTYWRIAYVISKKGTLNDSGHYRPIGLASIFCNAPVLCRMLPLRKAALALDIAQGGFCENRGVLDQVSCLAGGRWCFEGSKGHHTHLTFLEAKAAYDTVNRNRFWSAVQYLASPPLLALLKKALFDAIHIEALLSHVVSCQFSPRTDVS